MSVKPLKGYNAVGKTIRSGRKFYARGVIAFIEFAPVRSFETAQPQHKTIVYLGVTSKRGARPAVYRNRVKRLLRESFRQLVHSLDNQGGDAGVLSRVVLIWGGAARKAKSLRLGDVQPGVRATIQQAIRYYVSTDQSIAEDE